MKSNLTIPLQIKKLTDREFEGHGSIFGNEDLGGDVVVPGAFKRTLAQHRKTGSLPQMFWMHDPSRVPGKWLTMKEDKDGLKVKGTLAETPLGDEIRTLLQMDAVKGLSIGYRTIDQDFDDDGRRLLKEIELWEVSVVSLPMNPLAQVAHAKSQLSATGEYVPTPREFERILRDVGCSQMVAKRMMSKIFEDEKAYQMSSILEAEKAYQDDLAAKATNLLEESMVDASIIALTSKLFDEDESARDVSDDLEAEKAYQADLAAQVTSLLEGRMVDATVIASMSKLFEDENLSREVPDSTRDVEVNKDESDTTRDVEVDIDDSDLARAANEIAERMFAATIKVPRI